MPVLRKGNGIKLEEKVVTTLLALVLERSKPILARREGSSTR